MVEQRGRKTALDHILTVLPGGGRPEPPDDMPEAQAQTWRDAVDGMPVGWFGPQNADLLGLYCVHVDAAKTVAEQVRRVLRAPVTEARLKVLNRLTTIARRETSAVCSLAMRLRLAPQATTRKVIAEAAIRNAPKGPRPWED